MLEQMYTNAGEFEDIEDFKADCIKEFVHRFGYRPLWCRIVQTYGLFAYISPVVRGGRQPRLRPKDFHYDPVII